MGSGKIKGKLVENRGNQGKSEEIRGLYYLGETQGNQEIKGN